MNGNPPYLPNKIWGVRVNPARSLNNQQEFDISQFLALIPSGTYWAHWGPKILGHATENWIPVLPCFGGAVYPLAALAGMPGDRTVFVGNDLEQFEIEEGRRTVEEVARRHADQLAVVRQWAVANGKRWVWGAPQWNVTARHLPQLTAWHREMREVHGYFRPAFLLVHFYGAHDAASFWEIAGGLRAWRDDKLPGTRVIVSEFSGWPGSSLAKQIEVMEAGRELAEQHEWIGGVFWFSAHKYFHQGQLWGSHLAEVDAGGNVGLTRLGEHWVSLY
jgi:hypothetical protein